MLTATAAHVLLAGGFVVFVIPKSGSGSCDWCSSIRCVYASTWIYPVLYWTYEIIKYGQGSFL